MPSGETPLQHGGGCLCAGPTIKFLCSCLTSLRFEAAVLRLAPAAEVSYTQIYTSLSRLSSLRKQTPHCLWTQEADSVFPALTVRAFLVSVQIFSGHPERLCSQLPGRHGGGGGDAGSEQQLCLFGIGQGERSVGKK